MGVMKFRVLESNRILHAKFHPIGVGVEALDPKTENFTEFRNIIAQQGRIPCAIFTKFSGLVGSSSEG